MYLPTVAFCIDHIPSQEPNLVAYQLTITSVNTLNPQESWLDYDVKFQTLVASKPTL